NTLGRLTSPVQFADIIVKTGQGSGSLQPAQVGSTAQNGTTGQATGIVRLRDVVTVNSDIPPGPKVELGSQQYDQSCTLDGKPSVALSIYQLRGSNALETASGVY